MLPTTQRRFQLKHEGTGTTAVIDVGKILSEMNHRLYRQGRSYTAKVSLDIWSDGSDFDFPVEVYSLRPTWMTIQSWRKAFEAYMNAHADEIAHSPKNRLARWRDFRVKLLNDGIVHADMKPLAYTVDPTTSSILNSHVDAGEFIDSNVAATNVLTGAETMKNFCWIMNPSAVSTNYDICYEAERTSDTQDSPEDTTSQSAPYSDLSSIEREINEAEYDNIAADGNAPPYDSENWLSGVQLQLVDKLGVNVHGTGGATDSVQTRYSTPYFDAICGFILLKNVTDDFNGQLTLEVKSGNYKGVASVPLGKAVKSGKIGYRVVDA
jgi:hypothetical protein